MDAKNAVALSGVTKAFQDFALDSVTLAVPEGTICGLVGENGAGKTTLIRLLMGAIQADAGEISLLGRSPGSRGFREAKEDVGVVLDDAYFPEVMTAAQVGKVMRLAYRRWDAQRYADYLRRFELPDKKPFKEYSRGMRMKLAISAALSHDAKLLVLDEATAGLDPIVRDEIIEAFRDFALQDGRSVLISSHIVSDLEKLCDTIAFLHRGKLLFCEEKDNLLEQYGIFKGTAEQAGSLLREAVVGREESAYGGVRALVRRDAAPPTLTLERPTLEDVILFAAKGAKGA
ncbi:MAG: ABC transporter ATP-binding protein [Oscillibacter sp.]|nr:ABC transporter ATP-binding protein [Oscillibacter sp.]